MPKVSIILPTYRRPGFLYSAISSVLNQTFRDFELIVVDDASGDNTVKIVSSFGDRRIRYIYILRRQKIFRNNCNLKRNKREGRY